MPNEESPLFELVLHGERALAFGLLGEHLGHSHSPAIHGELGSAPYDLVEVPRDRVCAFLEARRFRGLNVTIPYKKEAAQACDELSPAARRLGNANTLVVRPNGSLYGDNTDYHGFSRQLASTGVSVEGRSCLVIGDGGAAATVRAVLQDQGACEVVTATRRGSEHTLPLAALNGLDCLPSGEAIPGTTLAQANELRERLSVIVNATPVGMYPHANDEVPVRLERFPQLACVCDLVYNPLATRLIQEARDRGIPAASGLLMLVAQAKRSSDQFLNEERPDSLEDEVYKTMRGRLQSISLIGMPGCGKTRTGLHLAKELGYEFVDVDDLVVAEAGMPIPQFFATQGEEAFRDLETLCTAQALAKPGRVVATGGGVVTRERNRFLLRQNGPVVLLTRGLEAPPQGEDLTLEGRPVSQAKGLDQLRAERAPLYHAWADIKVDPHPDGARATARRAARAIQTWMSL